MLLDPTLNYPLFSPRATVVIVTLPASTTLPPAKLLTATAWAPTALLAVIDKLTVRFIAGKLAVVLLMLMALIVLVLLKEVQAVEETRLVPVRVHVDDPSRIGKELSKTNSMTASEYRALEVVMLNKQLVDTPIS